MVVDERAQLWGHMARMWGKGAQRGQDINHLDLMTAAHLMKQSESTDRKRMEAVDWRVHQSRTGVLAGTGQETVFVISLLSGKIW